MWTEDKNLERKKKIKSASIQFFLWIVFLWIVFVYLKDNPAEKVSIVTWPKVLYQNTKVFFYKIFTDSWEILEEKYSMQRTFEEILVSAEWSRCFEVDELQEINDLYKKIQDMWLDEYNEKRNKFIDYASRFSQKINGNCE